MPRNQATTHRTYLNRYFSFFYESIPDDSWMYNFIASLSDSINTSCSSALPTSIRNRTSQNGFATTRLVIGDVVVERGAGLLEARTSQNCDSDSNAN